MDLSHAEQIPFTDLQKPQIQTFYLPMHAVKKESSSTTKIRAVFDACMKSSSGTSLNDMLLVGPTVHPPLIDVLLRFRLHRIALTADISKMYRAVELADQDRDLHRYVWRHNPQEPLLDYRIARLTFGVSASAYAANMSVKKNALDLTLEYPQAAKVVEQSFYVDDCLTSADTVEEAVKLRMQFQDLLARGGFLLRKWSSSDPTVLQSVLNELKDSQAIFSISDSDHQYNKTLGIEWNTSTNQFRLTISDLHPVKVATKRFLVSDIAKTFDILGWFSTTIIKAKILLQQLWEEKVDWDDPVPPSIQDPWMQWRSELKLLMNKHIPCCHFKKDTRVKSVGFVMPRSEHTPP